MGPGAAAAAGPGVAAGPRAAGHIASVARSQGEMSGAAQLARSLFISSEIIGYGMTTHTHSGSTFFS